MTFTITSQKNPEVALQTIESIYKKVQILKEFPESGYRYNRNHSHHIRILLHGHYRIAYLIKPDRNIDILGVFHGSLDIERYLIELGWTTGHLLSIPQTGRSRQTMWRNK